MQTADIREIETNVIYAIAREESVDRVEDVAFEWLGGGFRGERTLAEAQNLPAGRDPAAVWTNNPVADELVAIEGDRPLQAEPAGAE